MRLIDADKLKIYISEQVPLKKFMSRDVGKACVNMNSILDVVELQPTVDAVPVVHGHWIEGEGTWYCSVCGKEDCDAFLFFRGRQFDLYCPKCGAKMDEVSV